MAGPSADIRRSCLHPMRMQRARPATACNRLKVSIAVVLTTVKTAKLSDTDKPSANGQRVLLNSDLFEEKLPRGGFGGGMQTVLRDFVDAAGRRALARTIKVIERAGAFADGETIGDGLCYVRF